MDNLTKNNNPYLATREIQDVYVRENFLKLQDYFNKENQLYGFRFFEVKLDKAVTNYKVAHGLSIPPRDVVMSHISGPGIATFNLGKFDTKNMDITTTGAVLLRFYAGTYWDLLKSTSVDTNTTMSFSATVSSGGGGGGGTTYSVFTTQTDGLAPKSASNPTGFLRGDGAWVTISIPPPGMTNPMTTAGDTIYGGASGTPTALAAGLQGFYLGMGGSSVPAWSSPGYDPVVVTTSVSLGAAHRGKLLLCSASFVGYPVTLPLASVSNGYVVTIMKSDTSLLEIVVTCSGSDTFILRGTQTKTLSKHNQWMTVYCDGTYWYILGSYTAEKSLGTLSNVKTATGSGRYHNMVNNSITLSQGVWEIFPQGAFSNDNITNPQYNQVGLGIFGSNGTDTAVGPATDITVVVSLISQYTRIGSLQPFLIGFTAGNYEVISGPTLIVTVPPAGATLYAVPYSVQVTSSSTRINVSLSARMIGF